MESKDPSENATRSFLQMRAYGEALISCIEKAQRVRFWVYFLGTLTSILIWKGRPDDLYWVTAGFTTLILGKVVPWAFIAVYSRLLKRAIELRFGKD